MAPRTDALMQRAGLPYRRVGSGPTLVLVHGYLGGAPQWADLMDHLKDRFDVIAPNLPGFGDAGHLEAPDRIEDFAIAVLSFLDDLGVGNFALLGHSMGGMIAQEMATLSTDRIDALVLYGTGPIGRMPDRFETIAQSKAAFARYGVAGTSGRIAATWFVDGEKGQGFALTARLGALANANAAGAALEAMQVWDGCGALGKIQMPTLVIWGGHDQSYRRNQIDLLLKGLPQAELTVLPHAAHAAHLEAPQQFHAQVDLFLNTVYAPSKTNTLGAVALQQKE